MPTEPVPTENIKFVLARLRLAQDLLEESDSLPGRDGYDLENPKTNPDWWRHMRHEREALVIYLLLTCFDKLGQDRGFMTFQNWLQSKKHEHANQRNQVIKLIKPNSSPIDQALALANEHQQLFGVKNSFFRGIEKLSPDSRKKLLDSVEVRFSPNYVNTAPDTSPPSHPLSDQDLERRLKLQFIYDKRNQFTHKLEQHYQGSSPLIADNKDSPSWQAMVTNSELKYLNGNQDVVVKQNDAYIYSTYWPFILFEILHDAVGSKFHRTDIDVRFEVMFLHDDFPSRFIRPKVRHRDLKNAGKLASELWAAHRSAQLPSNTQSKNFSIKSCYNNTSITLRRWFSNLAR